MKPLPSKTQPIFGDEVFVSFTLKKSKDGSRKDVVVRLSFVDSMRKEVVADIVLSPVTAEALAKILENTLKKIDEVMQGKQEIKKEEESTFYIG